MFPSQEKSSEEYLACRWGGIPRKKEEDEGEDGEEEEEEDGGDGSSREKSRKLFPEEMKKKSRKRGVMIHRFNSRIQYKTSTTYCTSSSL